jgi:hypothetical protein
MEFVNDARSFETQLRDAVQYASHIVIVGIDPDDPDALRSLIIKPLQNGTQTGACEAMVADVLVEISVGMHMHHGPGTCV